jgi:xanthine dehydrogenase accessory factor
MELKLLDIIKEEVKSGRKVCHAVIIEREGSTPRSVGTSMIIKESGEIAGTVGGGKVEYNTILEAKNVIRTGKDKVIDVNLTSGSSEQEKRSGRVKVFIKLYKPENNLIIVGAGHVGYCLYKIAVETGFTVSIFDNRKELLTKEKYPKAEELILGDIVNNIKNYNLQENSYIVIASSSHKTDENTLKEVINCKTAYLGMLGSNKKVKKIMDNLLSQGIDKESMKKVYAPIGIGIGGETPEEVAVSILSEIVMVKNKGNLKHLSQLI